MSLNEATMYVIGGSLLIAFIFAWAADHMQQKGKREVSNSFFIAASGFLGIAAISSVKFILGFFIN